MTYPWDDGALLTHTDLNTEIKRPHICTSSARPSHLAGLTIFETDTGVTYQSDGTDWWFVSAPQHICQAKRSSTQSLAGDSLPHDVGFNAEVLDPLGMHSTVSSDWNFTIPAGGSVPRTYVYYRVSCSVGLDDIASGRFYITLVNVTTGVSQAMSPLAPTQGTSGITALLTKEIQVSPGDVLKITAVNTSGTTKDIDPAERKTYIDLRRVG